MAPRYSSYYTSDEREGPFERGFEGAYVKPAVDPSDAVAVTQYPAAAYPSYDGLVSSLEPGYQKMIQGQLRTLDQQGLAAAQKFENLTFNDKFDNEEDQIGQAIGKTLLALLPIAGGYILGGDRLAAAGAGAGLGGLKTFEDQVAQEEKMGEKKKAIIAKQYAAEMEALAKQKEQIVDRAFKDQDKKQDREFQIQNREDQQRFQVGQQAQSQAFQRELFNLREKNSRGQAVASPELLRQRAKIFEETGKPELAQELVSMASAVEAGKTVVPLSNLAFGSWSAPRYENINVAARNALATSAAASSLILPVVDDLKTATKELNMMGRSTLGKISSRIGAEVSALDPITGEVRGDIVEAFGGQRPANIAVLQQRLRPISQAIANSIYGSSSQSQKEGERIEGQILDPAAISTGASFYTLYGYMNSGISKGESMLRTGAAKPGQKEALLELYKLRDELDSAMLQDDELRFLITQGRPLYEMAPHLARKKNVQGVSSKSRQELIDEALK